MIKLKIGIDWDDVTAPFNAIAVEMANKYENANVSLDMITWGNTNGTECLNKYYSDKRLYEKQFVPDENKKCILELMEIADVYFITAVSSEFMGVRAKQIKETFPNIDDNQIILGAAKTLVKFDIVLDDGIHNLLDSPSKFKVLMRQPWNKEMTGMLAVNNLKEFVVLVKQILNSSIKEKKTIETPAVIALVGASGSGKNQIAEELINLDSKFVRPIGYSTNPYCKNHKIIASNNWKDEEYFEHTYYGGYRYGTKYEDIYSLLNQNKYVVIPIDMCGAISMKRVFDTYIFFISKRKEVLIKEILNKNIDNDEKTLRLLSLDIEKSNAEICDYYIDNNDNLGTKKISSYIQ